MSGSKKDERGLYLAVPTTGTINLVCFVFQCANLIKQQFISKLKTAEQKRKTLVHSLHHYTKNQ